MMGIYTSLNEHEFYFSFIITTEEISYTVHYAFQTTYLDFNKN